MKKKLLSLSAILLSAVLLFSSCKDNTTTENGNWETGEIPSNVEITHADTSMIDFTFSKRDVNNDFAPLDTTRITFSTDSIGVIGVGAVVNGNQVFIKSGGTYTLSGSSPNARVVVEASKVDKISLLLNGVKLSSTDGPAIYVKTAEKVFITVVKDTDNVLSDGNSYTMIDEDTTLDAAIFSKEDLTINGKGNLTVNGNCKHGIVSKDDLIIAGSNLTVTAANVALSGKDCVKIGGGTVNVSAGTDAIRSDNKTESHRGFVYIENGTLNVVAQNDAIQAENIVRIVGGTLNITTHNEIDSSKGIKSASDIIIEGGSITVNSQDDCINSASTVHVSGGSFNLQSGDDAIHADADLLIAGGDIKITNCKNGLDGGDDVVVNGGTVNLTAVSDGLSAKAIIAISGGLLTVNAGDDGMDSDASIFICGGITLISCATGEKNNPIVHNGSVTVTGGVLIATGAATATENFSEAKNQGAILATFDEQPAATTISLCDESGNVVVSFTPSRAYSSALITSPDVQNGKTYTVVCGGTVAGVDTNGYAAATTVSGGTTVATVKMTSNLK